MKVTTRQVKLFSAIQIRKNWATEYCLLLAKFTAPQHLHQRPGRKKGWHRLIVQSILFPATWVIHLKGRPTMSLQLPVTHKIQGAFLHRALKALSESALAFSSSFHPTCSLLTPCPPIPLASLLAVCPHSHVPNFILEAALPHFFARSPAYFKILFRSHLFQEGCFGLLLTPTRRLG